MAVASSSYRRLGLGPVPGPGPTRISRAFVRSGRAPSGRSVCSARVSSAAPSPGRTASLSVSETLGAATRIVLPGDSGGPGCNGAPGTTAPGEAWRPLRPGPARSNRPFTSPACPGLRGGIVLQQSIEYAATRTYCAYFISAGLRVSQSRAGAQRQTSAGDSPGDVVRIATQPGPGGCRDAAAIMPGPGLRPSLAQSEARVTVAGAGSEAASRPGPLAQRVSTGP